MIDRGPGSHQDRAARAALTWLTEPGDRTVWALVRDHGAPDTLDALLDGDAPDARLRAAVAARTAATDPRRAAETQLRHADRLGVRLVVPADEEWPSRVDDLATLELGVPGRVGQDTRPPLCFWVRGSPPLAETLHRSVAVVGARAATEYGTHVTTEMAFALAGCEWTIVSGGAFGIDATAHRGALAAGGRTVSVLACGVDRPYPVGNTAMFEEIAQNGLLISEWPLGAEPLRHRFLIRNRVIAAATAGTVVVEAAARSGAVQTMGRVISLNRPALVVPGPVTSAMSVGCHELLRTQPSARLVTSAADVLEEVGRIGEHLSAPARGREHPRDALDEESALILEAVPARGWSTPDELAAQARVSVRTVLRRLPLLEGAGLVTRTDEGIGLAPDRTT
ncbi:DNA-processing protein DprA [Actinoplanes sp. NBRC 101535]|uniref:DNA-processing protein DprA n=1 Tax=Actinoplanes sp. NBRC 101535 TaxID=3032196 RepID=UPI0024A573CA|nr:DNA-processing protein DprA [Actinoplanes sp. NBRC 101535]GLY04849.1 DNA processing protein DprA [Actinoplanes sp. NBRC 101535]